jgi:hypothetical protein
LYAVRRRTVGHLEAGAVGQSPSVHPVHRERRVTLAGRVERPYTVAIGDRESFGIGARYFPASGLTGPVGSHSSVSSLKTAR